MVSAGRFYTVLLQSDGLAVACGRYIEGQCRIPPLHEGVKYTQVSAGDYHTVLLRSDGCAVESSLPPLDEGVTYTQVSASYDHMMLLRSDGSAVACGWNNFGHCEILSLKYLRNWFRFWVPSLFHVSDLQPLGRKPDRVCQLCFDRKADAVIILKCLGSDGSEKQRIRANGADLASRFPTNLRWLTSNSSLLSCLMVSC
jgi:hypothetical protein